ncbi:hypothetical protein [Chryseobacterium rhizosphaerae]|jgi:bifunctional N-acetylglucosamine-1-phosphate-uridyltransferase/glucosamine-1-phosphate-acetyltransferase GlmU-like protein|uniref:Uncharacterized protein n=1 Tax=Chryseobacterium rhizosphaerae TaxID=395937 RepID=A0ABX9ILF9_9FLAO|nr:hypothetical protein [Chryseobacterium rhizosphaerae]MDR6546238.1 bifunctional N-acetylglucosamine-1-phosphate-uridyltransferase/glucosamine-1-phosphate-acetyltransferase GlmU-like protein [Chryseobacterium rhizosphaerae]REC75427.1 hypothetical protein DRF57_10420 [Chryseobacterium rhizosphaerae]GEN66351.1 hypothetical protein CRH01_09190 [Chryseobacterium rhizosphaerae]
MEIDTFKNQLTELLCHDFNTWNAVLNNTQPEGYICNHWKVDIDSKNINIDLNTGMFVVDDGFLSSHITFVKNGNKHNEFYNKAFTVKGKFENKGLNLFELKDIDVDIEIDIF